MATRNKQGDRVSYAVVNGQTGKIAADIPIDFGKYVISSLLLAIPLFILFNLFLTLTPAFIMCVSLFFSFVSIIILASQAHQLNARSNGSDDKGTVFKKDEDKSKKKKD